MNEQRGVFARFLADESGLMSTYGLIMGMAIAVVSAIGLDYAQAQSVRTQLQSAADAAAHAALYVRDIETGSESKKTAVAAARAVVESMLPEDVYGETVRDADVKFGVWDDDTRTFQVKDSSRSAVRVITYRTESRGNAVRNYLFKLVGIDTFDVAAQSIFTTFRPTCFEEGFVAEDVVDVQSNNNYLNGFCIHSNAHVEINSNNFFDDGTIVSMPDTDDLVMPKSGEESNIGIVEAIRTGAYRMRLVSDIPDIAQGIADMDPEYLPSYVDKSVYKQVNDVFKINADDLYEGYVNFVTCSASGGGRIQFEDGPVIKNLVLWTTCPIKFNQSAELQNVKIITTSTSGTSMNSASSLILGLDDECAVGGGVQLVTKGGVSFTSDLHMFGSQILAADDVEFSANANGIEGASIISGGRIDGTSNMNMSFCGSGMEDNYSAEYFRMAL